MLREFKYFFYIVLIFIFFFFTLRFYISNENIKNTYRSYDAINEKEILKNNNLFTMKSNTENIIEYVKKDTYKKKKKYTFWNLLNNEN